MEIIIHLYDIVLLGMVELVKSKVFVGNTRGSNVQIPKALAFKNT